MSMIAQFATLIGEAVAKGIAASSPKPKVTFGQYDPKSQFHPDKKSQQKMNRKYFQNGAEFQHDVTYDEEIALLNRITHSGRYINRLVEVSVRDEGGDQVSVHINYSNKRDHMNVLIGNLVTLPESKTKLQSMLAMIVEAQELEDLETEELEQARRAARAKRQK